MAETHSVRIVFNADDAVRGAAALQRALAAMGAEGVRVEDKLVKVSVTGSKGARDQAREINKLQREYSRLVREIDPARAAEERLAKAQETLNRAVKSGVIASKEHQRLLEKAKQHYSQTEQGTLRLSTAVKTLAGSYVALKAAQVVKDIVSIGQGYERLRAQLKTVEGDQARANKVFEALQGFAAKTPFSLEQVIAAYTRLRAVGIRPTQELMDSIGNTAAGWGNDIATFAEAVVAATTGEMERLKSFGIVARQEGDKVRFIYDGTETVVAKNATAIVAHLQRIGETKFAGGMDEQAKLSIGAVSNLEDAWSKTADRIYQSGLADAVSTTAKVLTEFAEKSPGAARVIGETLGGGLLMLATAATTTAKFVATGLVNTGEAIGDFLLLIDKQYAHVQTLLNKVPLLDPTGRVRKEVGETRVELRKSAAELEKWAVDWRLKMNQGAESTGSLNDALGTLPQNKPGLEGLSKEAQKLAEKIEGVVTSAERAAATQSQLLAAFDLADTNRDWQALKQTIEDIAKLDGSLSDEQLSRLETANRLEVNRATLLANRIAAKKNEAELDAQMQASLEEGVDTTVDLDEALEASADELAGLTAQAKSLGLVLTKAQQEAVLLGNIFVNDVATAIGDMVYEGDFSADRIKDAFLDAGRDIAAGLVENWIRALGQMLIEWLKTKAAMEAADVSIDASTGGGGGGGGLFGGLGSLFKGGGGGGAGGSSWMGAALGAAIVVGGFLYARERNKEEHAAAFGPIATGGIGGAGLSSSGVAGTEAIQRQILLAVQDFEEKLGASLSFFPNLTVQVSNDGSRFQASVGEQVVGVFESLDEAIRAGVAVAAQGAEGAIGENVAAVLRQSASLTEEQFEGLLAYAKQLDALDIPAAARDAYVGYSELLAQLGRSRDSARQLGVDSEAAYQLALEGATAFKGSVEDTLQSLIGGGSGIAQRALEAADAARAINQAVDDQALAVQHVTGVYQSSAEAIIQAATTAQQGTEAVVEAIETPMRELDVQVVDLGETVSQAAEQVGAAVADTRESWGFAGQGIELVGEAAVALGEQLRVSEELIEGALNSADRQLQVQLLEQLAVNENELRLLEQLKFEQELAHIQAIYAELLMLGRLSEAQMALFEGMIGRFESAGPAGLRPPRRGGGGHRTPEPTGPTPAEELADLWEVIDQLSREGLPPFERALLDIFDSFEEHIETARRLGEGEEELIRLREEAIQRLADAQIRDPLKDYLGPGAIEGGRWGMSDWQKQADDIRAHFDEIRAANQKLLDETGERAVAFWKINLAELRALQALAEQVIDGFGLPLEQTKDRIAAMNEALEFLQEMVDAGAISTERYGEVFGQLMDQAEADLLGIAAGILERMGFDEEAAELRMALEEAQFRIQVQQINMLYQAWVAAGLIAEDAIARWDELLGIINDPANWPDFSVPSPGGGPTTVPRPRPGGTDASEGILERIAAFWERLEDLEAGIGRSDLASRIARITDEMADLRAEAEILPNTLEQQALARIALLEQATISETIAEYLSRFVDVNDELDPISRRMLEINEAFDEAIELARQYGLSVIELEQQRQEALEQALAQGLQPIEDFLASMGLSQQSPLTPQQRYDAAQSQFDQLVQAALGGDLSALSQLPAAAQALLQEAGGAFGTAGEAYANIWAAVQAALAQVLQIGNVGGGTIPGTGGGPVGGGPGTGDPRGGGVLAPVLPFPGGGRIDVQVNPVTDTRGLQIGQQQVAILEDIRRGIAALAEAQASNARHTLRLANAKPLGGMA